MNTRVSSAVLTEWIRPPSMPKEVRFSLFILAVHLLTLLPIELQGLSIVQAVSGFLILSFVPGLLLISYGLDEYTLTNFLYGVGFSVAFSMLLGTFANMVYLGFPVGVAPFEQPTMSLLYVGACAALAGFVWIATYNNDTQPVSLQLPDYNIRILVLLGFIPVFAVIGAVLINRHAFNELTLFTIVCIALAPIFVYYFDKRGTYYPIAITAISSGLLLQNTVIMTYLGRGDGLGEYSYAVTVLQNGFWIADGTFGSMPRIVTLQPAYSLVMDTSLLWVFKLVHPVLFVVVPLVTYVLAARYFSKDIAFLSATLYIFLPRTYQIISRNTRTGGAIFFTALLLLVILDTDLPSRLKRTLIILFFIGVITSHYGVGTLVAFALVVAYVLNVLTPYLLDNKRRSQLWFARVSLLMVLIITWYLYLTDGVFEFLVGAMYGQISDALFFTEESTATRSLKISESRGIFGMPPGSYEVMFVGHLLIGIFSSIGISLVYLRYLSHGLSYVPTIRDWVDRYVLAGLSDNVLEDSNYVHLTIAIFLFFPLSFGPQILSAGRTFALVMVIVAPLPILVLRSTRLTRIGAKPALAAMAVFLLVTSGFVAASVTHDVSPQPIIDSDRIVEDGSTLEQFALYRSSFPENSIEASNFMLGHLPQGATVHRTGMSKFTSLFYPGEDRSKLQFTGLNSSNENPQGYAYFSEPQTVTGTNPTGHAGFIFYEYDPLPSYSESNMIYTSGQDEIYYHGAE